MFSIFVKTVRLYNPVNKRIYCLIILLNKALRRNRGAILFFMEILKLPTNLLSFYYVYSRTIRNGKINYSFFCYAKDEETAGFLSVILQKNEGYDSDMRFLYSPVINLPNGK